MLEGIRIADMTTVIFGPFCTQMLADMGADVIKIEPAIGDIGRRVGSVGKTPGMGALHMNVNRNKRSVNWDLKSEDGRAKVQKLIASSDVFINNVRTDAIRRVGLDYDTVKIFAPNIIYIHCVGFDSEGPDAAFPAYDDIIQGGSGIASLLQRVNGGPPQYLPLAIGDKVGSFHALQATLAAIIHKLRTGKGQYVEVPLFEATTAFNLVEHLGGGTFPHGRRKMGYSRQISSARQPSPTADGYICLAPYDDDRWIRFFDVVGRPEVLQDERLNTPALRLINVNLLYEIINGITPSKTTKEWAELMRANDIPARQVNTLEDLLEDPQLRAVGFFREREHPTEGLYREIRPVIKFAARPNPPIGYPPHLGQHNVELAAELGCAPGNNVPQSNKS
jgi:crotonobetainyl-CoA:carnitine CoA-transferase CaiB-like acyl-CoA transferase